MQDPYSILGVSREAGDEAIHQAYLAAVRECPAERDPERFRAVREAYERLRTEGARLDYELFDAEVPGPADLWERATASARPERPSLEVFRALLRAARPGRGS